MSEPMNYGLQTLEAISEPYLWRYGSLAEAQKSAEDLCERHRVKVIVFEILGTWEPATVWRNSGPQIDNVVS